MRFKIPFSFTLGKRLQKISCTAWVHGIHPQRLSFFEDKLYQSIEELGREGVGGHEQVEERERGFEKSGSAFETALAEFDHGGDEPFSGDDFSSRRSRPRLGLTGSASKWRKARLFFKDLMDYLIERKSAENQEFWRKMEKWEFERKMNKKNRAGFRFKALSWDEAV